MNKLARRNIVLFTVSACFAFLALSSQTRAEEMSSANYKIISDTVNVGGIYSASVSYSLDDTLGEQGTGENLGSSYNLYAGFWHMQESYIAMSAASDVAMSPSIGGLTGGTSDGQTSVTVTTDNLTGYSLAMKSENSPSMRSQDADTITDYTPSGANPDFDFSVADADSEFAFTPEGADIVQKYRDNGTTCNAGSGDTTDKCWYNPSTADETIAQSSGPNQPGGTITSIKFRVKVGSVHFQPEGTYVSTTTLTAVTL